MTVFNNPLLLFTVTLYYYDYFRHMGGASPAWSQQVVVVTVHSTSPFAWNRPIAADSVLKEWNNNTIDSATSIFQTQARSVSSSDRTSWLVRFERHQISPNKVTSQIMPTSVWPCYLVAQKCEHDQPCGQRFNYF
jgi:hypothetical protein